MLNRLTKRAKTALMELPKDKRPTVASILSSIRKSGGMGNIIILNNTISFVSKRKAVNTEDLIKEAYFQAIKFEHTYVGTEHLLLALLVLVNSKDYEKIKLELIKLNLFSSAVKPVSKDKRASILETFGENLNHKTIKSLDVPLIPRSDYNSLLTSLLLKSTPNVLMVGDSGVGKRKLVELLARNIVSLDIPPALAGYNVLEFDLLAFMSGMASKGGIEGGFSQLAEELKGINRAIILIKNFQSLFFATAAGLTLPVFYSMFMSSMNELGIRVITTMNSSLYDKIFADNEHFLEDFVVIEINEPSEKETQEILKSTSKYLGLSHNIHIPLEVTQEIYKIAKDLKKGPKFPQRGVDLMDHCCTYTIMRKSKIPESYKLLVDESFELLGKLDSKLEKGHYEEALELRNQIKKYDSKLSSKEHKIFSGGKKLTLTLKDVKEAAEAFGQQEKRDDDKFNVAKLSSLSEKVSKRIIGQEDAVSSVVKSLIRSKLGLRSKKRPLGNFLFLGPTGVGKTELAKVLAEEFFGDKSLIRLDMSDFSEKHTVARLVGAPPGYVGYGEGGELTSKISINPNSVVLFDEIEKAHPDVLNILLQIMEEGELADAKGSIFDFSSAVIILTSNQGTDILHKNGIGFDDREISDNKIEGRLKENVKKILKPELVNRFDEIIIFKRLKKESQLRVLELLVNDITNTLKDQKIYLKVNKGVKTYLLKLGYSKEYGARALRRTLEKELLDVIAGFLLKNIRRPLSIKASLVGDNVKISLWPK